MSQKWYVDVISAIGPLEDLLLFFKQLTEHGTYFGYSVNDPKCQLIVKDLSKLKALWLFERTRVQNVEGCRVLGSVNGIEKDYDNFNVTTAVKYSNLLKKKWGR